MKNEVSDPLVSTEWLAARLTAPDIRIVDASWHMPAASHPAAGNDARAEYQRQHIPGAVFFDIDEIADRTSGLPHMLPDPVMFASRMKKLGLGDGNRIVVYDTTGIFSAARVWWTFRVMGHRDVVVLDGGFPKWLAGGYPLSDMPPVTSPRHFTPRPDWALVRACDQLCANLSTRAEQIIDARSAGRFRGTEPEPRSGLRSGHIPGSLSLPYGAVLAPDGTMRSVDDLRAVFGRAGADLSRPITLSCGSGISASVLALALYRMGVTDAAVYDGSWSEWGARTDLPVET